MDILIQQVDQLPSQIQDLVVASEKEGFHFIQKLVDEFQQGTNQFNRHGEFLLVAFDGAKLVACGGLNIQMSDDQEANKAEAKYKIGRVRRFYVLPEYRRSGLAKRLLQELEKRAKANFSALCLYTGTTVAAKFYQKQNYVFVENHSNYNYFKYLI